MKIFLSIYGFLQITTFFWWIYTMLITKPKFLNGKNRFLKNWNEGGMFTLISFSVYSLLSALITLVFVAAFNVLTSFV